MVTYLYWSLVIAVAFGLVFLLGGRWGRWRGAAIAASVTLVIGWAAFFFYFEQIFVKRYGGVMTIRVPAGQQHIAATWKDDNLWVENYDPEKNECIFYEYSKGNVLEGRVKIRNCNPLGVKTPGPSGLGYGDTGP
ncbi:MAG: hypothetical protein V2J12_07240 [Gammaproteobacteria bacterium]|jgi:hypothetical protein|nr:hypothetical protein [Gammaproteobacteria bacterium]